MSSETHWLSLIFFKMVKLHHQPARVFHYPRCGIHRQKWQFHFTPNVQKESKLDISASNVFKCMDWQQEWEVTISNICWLEAASIAMQPTENVFLSTSVGRPARWLQPQETGFAIDHLFSERRSHGFCWEKWDPEANLLLGCVWFTTFIGILPTFPKVTPNKGLLLVGGLEHEFYFP